MRRAEAGQRDHVVQRQKDSRSGRGVARLDLRGLTVTFFDPRVFPFLGIVIGVVVGTVLVMMWSSRGA